MYCPMLVIREGLSLADELTSQPRAAAACASHGDSNTAEFSPLLVLLDILLEPPRHELALRDGAVVVRVQRLVQVLKVVVVVHPQLAQRLRRRATTPMLKPLTSALAPISTSHCARVGKSYVAGRAAGAGGVQRRQRRALRDAAQQLGNVVLVRDIELYSTHKARTPWGRGPLRCRAGTHNSQLLLVQLTGVVHVPQRPHLIERVDLLLRDLPHLFHLFLHRTKYRRLKKSSVAPHLRRGPRAADSGSCGLRCASSELTTHRNTRLVFRALVVLDGPTAIYTRQRQPD